jgi:amidase
MTWESAADLASELRSGRRSAVEVMEATYERIEAVNPRLNALVNLRPRADALALAVEADRVPSGARSALHGLPMAPKDLGDVVGFPTTQGFVPFRNRIAAADGRMQARLREAGALFIGKSNTPEFGLGSHTFNSLFGATLNPWNPERTPGGSSGGAAVALASGMLSLADGSDMGGSLRNPASFCNVVGLRPSIGRVQARGPATWFGRISTGGPMGRTVADTALLFSVQAGPDELDPLTLSEAGATFRDAASEASVASLRDQPLRIAYSANLHGLPIAREVAEVIARAPAVFEELGWAVEEAAPDLSGAMEVFQTQRAATLSNLGRQLDTDVPDWRSHAKETAIWNIEQGFTLTSEAVMRSELARTQIYAEVAQFFDKYDALILPAAQVAPFPIETDWIREINGVELPTYLDWMTVCCAVSVTGLPAISVPGGFTSDGLPVGLQIVGKPRGDLKLLRIAAAFEAATEHHLREPGIHA